MRFRSSKKKFQKKRRRVRATKSKYVQDAEKDFFKIWESAKVPFVDTDNRSQSNQEDFYTQAEADEIGKQWDEGLPPAVIEEMTP